MFLLRGASLASGGTSGPSVRLLPVHRNIGAIPRRFTQEYPGTFAQVPRGVNSQNQREA